MESDLIIDDVYERIRSLILANVLRAGQKLVDRKLAEELGVSRTPVREALARLKMVGLVEGRDRRGYYVNEFSARQMADVYELRKLIEVHAAKLAARNAAPADLAELDQVLREYGDLVGRPEKLAAAVKSDMRIHEIIARASGNAALHEMIRNLLDKAICFMWMDDLTFGVEIIAGVHDEHRTLARAIKRKDEKRAAEAVYSHIDATQKRLEKVFQMRAELQTELLRPMPRAKASAIKAKSIKRERVGATGAQRRL